MRIPCTVLLVLHSPVLFWAELCKVNHSVSQWIC